MVPCTKHDCPGFGSGGAAGVTLGRLGMTLCWSQLLSKRQEASLWHIGRTVFKNLYLLFILHLLFIYFVFIILFNTVFKWW